MNEPSAADASPFTASEGTPVSKPRRKSLIALGVVVGVLFLGWLILPRALGVQLWWIPSESMEPAIPQGSRVVTWSFGDIERGDIVLIDTTGLDMAGQTKEIIKRVVAFEDETVAIVDGALVIDGEVLDEPYLPPDLLMGVIGPEGAEQEVTVPSGHVYVLGDNRNRTLDSRTFGPIPIDSVSANHAWVWWGGN